MPYSDVSPERPVHCYPRARGGNLHNYLGLNAAFGHRSGPSGIPERLDRPRGRFPVARMRAITLVSVVSQFDGAGIVSQRLLNGKSGCRAPGVAPCVVIQIRILVAKQSSRCPVTVLIRQIRALGWATLSIWYAPSAVPCAVVWLG